MHIEVHAYRGTIQLFSKCILYLMNYVISSTDSVNQPSMDSSELDVEFEASVDSSDLNAESPKIPSPAPPSLKSDAPPAVPEHGALYLHSYKRKAESPPGQTQLSKGNDSC